MNRRRSEWLTIQQSNVYHHFSIEGRMPSMAARVVEESQGEQMAEAVARGMGPAAEES